MSKTIEPAFELNPKTAAPILEVQDVNKRFASVHAVKNVSFSVCEGSIFALLGPNGAGKTTLVRMLLGINHPDSGTIKYVKGGEVRRVLPPEMVGYLPEERGLYKDQPILKTLVYMAVLRGMDRENAKREALRWLERFDIADRKNDKLDTLSKGNQQKVQFVSAILHQPVIAFLDEPFSGLDPLNQELVSGIIRELANSGMTIVLSAHQMDLVDKLADALVLLSHGEKILEGPIEHVRRTYPIPRELFVIYSEPPVDPPKQDRFLIERIGIHSLKIIGTEQTTKSDLIRFAAELGEIEQISSQVLKLHDVYVRAVKEHVSKQKEGL